MMADMAMVVFEKRLPSILRLANKPKALARLQATHPKMKVPTFGPDDIGDHALYARTRTIAADMGHAAEKKIASQPVGDRRLTKVRAEQVGGSLRQESRDVLAARAPAPKKTAAQIADEADPDISPGGRPKKPAGKGRVASVGEPVAVVTPKKAVKTAPKPAPAAPSGPAPFPATVFTSPKAAAAAAPPPKKAPAKKKAAAKRPTAAQKREAAAQAEAERKKKRNRAVGAGIGATGAAATAAGVGYRAVQGARAARAPIKATPSHVPALVGASAGGTAAGVLASRGRNRPDEDSDVGKALVNLAKMFADGAQEEFAKERDGDLTPGEAAAAGAGIGAAAGGVAAATIPVKRKPLSREAQKVQRKLNRNPLRTKYNLSAKEFAAINGGRGLRVGNNAYTARMAEAMNRGVVKPKRLKMDLYSNNVLQSDGAHRAHAAVMTGRKVPVKVVRHGGKEAPKASSLLDRALSDRGRKQHGKRLLAHERMPKSALREMGSKGAKILGPIARGQSKLDTLSSSKLSGPKKAALMVGATGGLGALAATGGLAARQKQKESRS